MSKKRDYNSCMKDDAHDDVELSPETDADQMADGDQDLEISEGSLNDKIKKLRTDLKKCQEEKGEYLAGWQRAKADFVNRERLLKEDAKLLSTHVLSRFLQDLMPVLDGFDLAVTSPAWQSADPSWRTGIEAVQKQLVDALSKNGVTIFDPRGAAFDPVKHEAVGTVPVSSEGEDHIVQTVLQKGYIAGERVVRPAKVVIGQYSPT